MSLTHTILPATTTSSKYLFIIQQTNNEIIEYILGIADDGHNVNVCEQCHLDCIISEEYY